MDVCMDQALSERVFTKDSKHCPIIIMGQWFAATCVTPGVTAWCQHQLTCSYAHLLSISICSSADHPYTGPSIE